MTYQSFPGEIGNSRSTEKLSALRLPDLKGKSFLDVGCNEGFFCGYAAFIGASRVVGIDSSKKFIERAKLRFPKCEFLNQTWDDIDLGSFDCILLASAIHYAEDQESLINRLMSALNPGGILVLEMGIASASGSVWQEVQRSIDKRSFPSRQKLDDILAPYAWKLLGESVNQDGDPLKRYVIHISEKRPYAFLALSEPGSGKSSLARDIFSKNAVNIVTGDSIYRKITEGSIEVSSGLKDVCKRIFRNDNIDQLTYKIISEGYLPEIITIWCFIGDGKDCFIDSYVPLNSHSDVIDQFSKEGYFPVALSLCETSNASSLAVSQNKCKEYVQKLESIRPDCKITRVKKLFRKSVFEKRELHWHLDQPRDSDFVMLGENIVISGWAFQDSGESTFNIFIDGKYDFKTLPLNTVRHDVIERFESRGFKFSDTLSSKPLVGFHYEISKKDVGDQLTVGLLRNGKKVPLMKITMPDGVGL
jgi:SAM-dependent methyltransferase